MNNNVIIGVDIGTSSCKTVIINYNGEILAESSQEYETYYPKIGWSEQDPRDWYNNFCKTLKESVQKACITSKNVSAISFSGATHTLALLDKDFKVIRKSILWTDKRTDREVNYLKRKYKNIFLDLGYNEINSIWSIAHLLWLKNNQPDIWNKIYLILPSKDYVRYRLTGQICTDYIDAAGTMLMSMKNFKWSDIFCKYINLNKNTLPTIMSPFDIAGKVSNIGAKESGLLEGTPVIVGSTDTATEVFCNGAIKEGDFTIKLATAGRICIVSNKPIINSKIVNYPHVIKNKWYPGTGTSSCATSYRWFRNVFCGLEKNFTKQTDLSTYELMDLEAVKSPVGSKGLLYHPYLLGECSPYFDSKLRADFVGFTLNHNKQDFLRSILEGVAFSLKDSINVLKKNKIFMNNGRIIGGGAKSKLWSQIISDVLNVELDKNRYSDSAFGAAMIAGIGIGIFKNINEAIRNCVKVESRVYPSNNINKYEELFEIYQNTTKRLKDINHQLYKFASN